MKQSSVMSLCPFALIGVSGIGAIPVGPHGLLKRLSLSSDDNGRLIACF